MKEGSVLVIADDFTGANDVGVQFTHYGEVARVLLNPHHTGNLADDGHFIVNTDSRSQTKEDAYKTASSLVRVMNDHINHPWIYKKIDSTLRGNIGAEIEAIFRETDLNLAILCPAFPDSARTIQQGHCYVHGQLITETEFATDPKTPVLYSSIPQIIAAQTSLSIINLTVEQFQSSDIVERLTALPHKTIVVFDAQTNDDLEKIAAIALQLKQKPLLVGSAGLAGAFIHQLIRSTQMTKAPLLAMIGTMSEITHSQVDFAKNHCEMQVIEINVSDLLSQPFAHVLDQYSMKAFTVFNQKTHCIMKTNCSKEAREQVNQLCEQHQLTRHELGNRISQFMGKLTQLIVDSNRPIGGLFLSGGDIATAVANAYQADFFEIKGQVGGSVPWGYFSNCSINHIPVMTKAGGFGQKHTFLDVIKFVEEKSSE